MRLTFIPVFYVGVKRSIDIAWRERLIQNYAATLLCIISKLHVRDISYD